MHELDDPRTYSRLDPTDMRERLRSLPRQCEAAWGQMRSFLVPEGWKSFDRVVIGGMGGSAIAGDLVGDLAAVQKSVPVVVVRDFHLPFALDARSLAIVCSYSGDTEETRSIFREVMESDARVVVISSGGVLTREANARGTPLIPIEQPGEPRSSVGYCLLLILGLLQRVGLVRTEQGEVGAAIEGLRQQVSRVEENVPTADNPAKQLALELQDKLIVVYGGGVFSGLARRWKTQFNENAKTWAFFDTIPELLHNSIEGARAAPGLLQQMMVLLLQPAIDYASLGRRYGAVSELLRKNAISHRVLTCDEGTPLSQVLGMMLLGDFVSYYLALLNGVDPAATPNINWSKQFLS